MEADALLQWHSISACLRDTLRGAVKEGCDDDHEEEEEEEIMWTTTSDEIETFEHTHTFCYQC